MTSRSGAPQIAIGRARGVDRDIELMTRVASQYYLEGMTQDAVARSLRLSRPKVGRLLDRARMTGIVEITVNVHPDIGLQVEAALVSEFGLNQVLLVNDQSDEAGQRASVARTAAGFLKRQLSDGDVVALGMGRNVGAVPDFVGTPTPRAATFVSAIGGSPLVDTGVNPNEICRRLARRLPAVPTCSMRPPTRRRRRCAMRSSITTTCAMSSSARELPTSH